MLGSLESNLKRWPNGKTHNIYDNFLNIFPSILMWKFWKETNKRISCEKEMISIMLINKIEACIVEAMNTHLRKRVKKEGAFMGRYNEKKLEKIDQPSTKIYER